MSLRRTRTATWGLLAALALLFCSLAFTQTPSEAADPSAGKAPAASASESSGGDDTAQFKHSASVRLLARLTGLSPEATYWLTVGLNFAIVVGVIGWAWKKNLPAMFRNRTASIQKALDEARHASEDARRRLTEVEARLSRLDDEINQMRATSEKEAAAEEERIKAAAAEDARHIIESAEQEIAAATKAARRELTAYAADLAVTLAAKQIRVDRPTDQALVRNFAQQIGDGASREEGLSMATVPSTYARAFADMVIANRLDPAKILAETSQIADLVRDNKGLRDVWENPAIPADQKRAVLDGIVKRTGISQPVRNFVAVVLDKGRMKFLAEIVERFRQNLNQYMGVADAEITTARDLTTEERTELERELGRATGKTIRAQYEQDRALLGGVVARVGSTVFDGSVRGQLERIRRQLVSA